MSGDSRFGAAAPAGNAVRALDRAIWLYPDRVAVTDGNRSLTYRELGERAQATAHALHDAGVEPGDRVALLMPNCVEFLPTVFGVWKARAAFTQLSPRAGVNDFRDILNMVGAKALVYHDRFTEAVSTIRPDLTAIEILLLNDELDAAIDASRGRRPLPPPADDNLAMVGITSGTTGRPKAVLLDHARWSYYAIVAGLEVGDTRPGEVFAHVAPLTHVTIVFVLPTLMRGGTNVVVDGFTPDAFADIVERHRVTATVLVPTIIYALLDSPDALARLGSLQTIVYAGAPMSRHRLAEGIEALGRVFVQTYAGSEPGFVSCLRKEEHDPTSEKGRARLASAGRPLPHVDVSIQDEDDAPLGAGEVGEICVRSPGAMVGYWDPTIDEEAIRDGWVHTGDVGRLDEDGYLYIVDRKKDMIVTGGMNVFPAQVEDVLTAHPSVAQCAVIGVPDEKWGEAVTAFCVLRPGAHADERDLIDAVKAQKGGVWAPKRIHFLDSLPTTPTGKPDKKALRAPYWEGRERAVH